MKARDGGSGNSRKRSQVCQPECIEVGPTAVEHVEIESDGKDEPHRLREWLSSAGAGSRFNFKERSYWVASVAQVHRGRRERYRARRELGIRQLCMQRSGGGTDQDGNGRVWHH